MFGKTPTCSFPQFRICGPAPHSESLFRLYFCRVANDATAFGKTLRYGMYSKKMYPVRHRVSKQEMPARIILNIQSMKRKVKYKIIPARKSILHKKINKL